MASWKFYGREQVSERLSAILQTNRFFFLKVEGRRRIGKSRLVLYSLQNSNRKSIRIQIPDAEPSGLVTTVREAMDLFQTGYSGKIQNLQDVARIVQFLIQKNYVVVLDEFQYLNRERLRPLLSYLQEVVDLAKFNNQEYPGGLIVAGSIHTEMEAILEDKDTPLYGRMTDRIELDHFTPATIQQILADHTEYTPEKLLFFYTLLEGVPKYYEDIYERDLFQTTREEVLKGLFFDSSAPLSNEAETWFLSGLKGRYVTILSALAQGNGYATHHEIQDFLSKVSEEEKIQVSAYLETLVTKYKILHKQKPIFTNQKSKHTRFAIQDNFLLAWLSAIAPSFRARGYMPLSQLLEAADQRLATLEGLVFEKLVRFLIRQRSREGLLDFNLTDDVQGYWNQPQHEVDCILMDAENQRIRFGSCKRDDGKLINEITRLPATVSKLLGKRPFSQYANWKHDFFLAAPSIGDPLKAEIIRRKKSGVIQLLGLNDLIQGTTRE